MSAERTKVLETAQKHLAKGHYDKAIAEYLKLVKQDPKDVRTWLKIGDLYTKKGSHREACDTYARVAQQYADQGFYVKALAVYRRILELDPERLDVQLKLAEAYEQLQLTSDALGTYEQVVASYARRGEMDKALATLSKMCDLDPDNIPVRIKYAEALSRAGKTDEAAAAFEMGATLLKELGRTEDYIKVAERLLFHRPEDPDVARELARLYLERDDPKRALAKLQISFKANQRDVDTLSMLAEAFRSLDQLPKTISVYKEIARVHKEANRVDERAAVLRRVLVLDPRDVEARRELDTLEEQVREEGLRRDPSASAARPSRRPGNVATLDDAFDERPESDPPTLREEGPELAHSLPADEDDDDAVMWVEERSDDEDLLLVPDEDSSQYESPPVGARPSPRGVSLPSRAAAPSPSFRSHGAPGSGASMPVPSLPVPSIPGPAMPHASLRGASMPGPGPSMPGPGPSMPSLGVGRPARAGALPSPSLPSPSLSSPALGRPSLPGLSMPSPGLSRPAPSSAPDVRPGSGYSDVGPAKGGRGARPDHPATSSIPPDVAREALIARLMTECEVFLRYGLKNKVIDQLHRVLDLEPRHVEARERLKDVYVEQGRTAEAAEQLEALADLFADGSPHVAALYVRQTIDLVGPDPRLTERLDHLERSVDEAAFAATPSSPPIYDDETALEEDEVLFVDDGTGGARRPVPSGLPGLSDGPGPALDLHTDGPFDGDGHLDEGGPPIDDTAPHDAYLPHDPHADLAQPEDAFAAAPHAGHVADLDSPFSLEEFEAGPVAAPSVAPPPPRETPAGDLEEILEEADFFLAQGVYDEARQSIEDALRRYPGHPLLEEKLEEIREASKGASLRPEARVPAPEADPTFLLAEKLAEEFADDPHGSDASEALDVEAVFAQFKKGVEEMIGTDNPEAHFDLGIAYKQMELLDDAIHEFELAMNHPSKECIAQTMIGLCYLEKGSAERAIDYFKRGLYAVEKSDREELGLYFELGNAYELLGDAREALFYYQKVERRDPTFRHVTDRIQRLSTTTSHVGQGPSDDISDDVDQAFDDLISEG